MANDPDGRAARWRYPIILPEWVAEDRYRDTHRIQAIIDYINYGRHIGFREEMFAPAALEVYYVDWWIDAIRDVGVARFGWDLWAPTGYIGESPWSETCLAHVRNGLIAVGADEHLVWLEHLLALWAEHRAKFTPNLTGEARAAIFDEVNRSIPADFFDLLDEYDLQSEGVRRILRDPLCRLVPMERWHSTMAAAARLGGVTE